MSRPNNFVIYGKLITKVGRYNTDFVITDTFLHPSHHLHQVFGFLFVTTFLTSIFLHILIETWPCLFDWLIKGLNLFFWWLANLSSSLRPPEEFVFYQPKLITSYGVWPLFCSGSSNAQIVFHFNAIFCLIMSHKPNSAMIENFFFKIFMNKEQNRNK